MSKAKETVKEFFERNDHLEVAWMNSKGEFFTSENLAKNSEKDAKKVKKVANPNAGNAETASEPEQTVNPEIDPETSKTGKSENDPEKSKTGGILSGLKKK